MGEGTIVHKIPRTVADGSVRGSGKFNSDSSVDFGITASSKDSQLGQQIRVSKSSWSFPSTRIRISGSSKNVQQARLGHNQGSKEAGGAVTITI